MSESVGSIHYDLKLDTSQFDKATSGLRSNLKNVGDKMTSVGRTMTTHVTLPIVAAGAAAIKLATDFESSMSKITGLVGVSREQVKQWSQELLKLGPEVGKSPKELADALFFVTSAGFEGAAAIDILTASAKASSGGLGETAVVVDAVTSAVNAYGIMNLTATQATDILTAAVREGKLEAASLAPVIGRVIPVAAELGVEFHEVAGFLAVASRTGMDAASAASSLRGILAKLIKPSQQAVEVLAEYGLTVDQVRKKIAVDGLVPTLRFLRDTFGDNQEAMGRVFEDVEALTGVLTILGQDASTVDEIMQSVANSSGSTADAFAAASDTMGFKWNQAKAILESSMIRIGDSLGPTVAKVVGEIAQKVESLALAFSNASPAIQDMIIKLTGVTAAAGPLLMVLGSISKGLAVLMSPITIIIAAFVAAGVAIYALITKWDDMSWKMRTFAATIGGPFTMIVYYFLMLRDAFNVMKDNFVVGIDWIQKKWNQFVAFIQALPSMIISFIEQLPLMTWSAIFRMAEAIGFIAGRLVRFYVVDVPNFIHSVINWFSHLPGNIAHWVSQTVNAVAGWFSRLPGIAAHWVSSTFHHAVAWFNNIRHHTVSIVGSMVEHITGWFRSLPGRLIGALGDIASTLMRKFQEIGGQAWEGFKRGLGIRSPSFIEEAMFAIRDTSIATVGQVKTDIKKLSTMSTGFGASMNLATVIPVTTAASGQGSLAPVTIGPNYINSEADADYLFRKFTRNQQLQSRGGASQPGTVGR